MSNENLGTAAEFLRLCSHEIDDLAGDPTALKGYIDCILTGAVVSFRIERDYLEAIYKWGLGLPECVSVSGPEACITRDGDEFPAYYVALEFDEDVISSKEFRNRSQALQFGKRVAAQFDVEMVDDTYSC